MLPSAYPPARQILRGDAPGSWAHNGPYKIVWHTTETLGLPAYDRDDDNLDAELAPHLTYDPKSRRWWQDYPLIRPSESLRVHDDDMVIQIEIICYSDKRTVDRYGGGRLWVGDLPDTAYQDLAAFSQWVTQYVPLPTVWPSPGRMSPTAFHAYNGHCGHVHVPDNTHWDPGVFDYNRLFHYIDDSKEEVMGLPVTKDSPNEEVRAIKEILNQAYGTNLPATDDWDAAMIAAVKTHTGHRTNHPDWKEGKGVGGEQYGHMLGDLARRYGGAPGGTASLEARLANIEGVVDHHVSQKLSGPHR